MVNGTKMGGSDAINSEKCHAEVVQYLFKTSFGETDRMISLLTLHHYHTFLQSRGTR